MKAAAKIFAYCVWFAFTLALSGLFFQFVIWVENHTGIYFGLRLWFTLISWFGFVAIMAWLPVWLVKKKNLSAARITAITATFLIALLFCTVLCTIVWGDFVVGHLFNCTDSLPFDFLSPGDWVHGNYVFVSKINPSDPMNMPDSIKEGWSIPKLWLLWCSFVAVSLAISALLAFLIYRPRKPKVAQTVSP
jgi:hypothetical protein